MDRARVVVIGGGIMGCNVAHQLAEAGCREVILLEKGDLTSGATSHAAGLITQFNPSRTMMRFRRKSFAVLKDLKLIETVGSLRFASTDEEFKEMQRGASRARGIGLEVELLSPTETFELMPSVEVEDLFGAMWLAGDGFIDPHTATHAIAKRASELGVTIRTHERVTGIEISPSREIKRVVTDNGAIETEIVVDAGGIWGPQIASMAGVWFPSTPVEHQHALLATSDGLDLPRATPCFRDHHYLTYGKSEAGGMLLGGWEVNPATRWIDGVPWSHGSQGVPPDIDRFRSLLEGAVHRFPSLKDAGIRKIICHPDAVTPDGNPLLGPVPDIRGFWVAAGLSFNGFGAASGMSESLAHWILEGQTELDLTAYRPWRFGSIYRDQRYCSELAREVYKYYYLLRYPFDQPEWGRPKRLSALHHRMQEAGAVFGTKNGWERPEFFRPGKSWERAGADHTGWGRPPYFDQLAREFDAVRRTAGVIDMSSFGKIELRGAEASGLLERVSDNLIDRSIGKIVYTQFLNDRGGILSDVTVTKMADCFRVVTGAGSLESDMGWLALHSRGKDVQLIDVTDRFAVIGVWGPNSRSILTSMTNEDLSNESFPFMTGRNLHLSGVDVFAQRITYVGELGWELWVDRSFAVQLWDRLLAAGLDHGITPIGYRVLDSLRIEQGYRYPGTDLTELDNPYEAGLGFCVRLEKGGFIGRDALLKAREAGLQRRLRTILVGDEGYVPIFGGEAIRTGSEIISRIRSCAYGFGVRRPVAYAYLPVGVEDDIPLEVDVFDSWLSAYIGPDILHDSDRRHARV